MGAFALRMAVFATAVCAALALSGHLAPSLGLASLLPLSLVVAAGVGIPASGVFARPILRGDSSRNQIALTFDDGPDPTWTPEILDLLDARGHRATFFVIGERAERHPELVRDIARRGHEVANHTWSHSYLTVFRAPETLARELERTNRIIATATGHPPRWFRPPVGLLSPRVPRATRLAKLRLVAWTASARDGVGRTTVAQAVNRLGPAIHAGAILVLHDGAIKGDRPPIAKAVLGIVLDRMQERGVRSVTLSELCRELIDTGEPIVV